MPVTKFFFCREGILFASLLLISLISVSPASAQPRDTLIVGYTANEPFVIQTPTGLSGPSVWLWQKVSEAHDIAYVYQEMSLDSLLNGLATGTVDLSLSPLTITSERMARMDFSSPYFIAHSSLLQKEVSPIMKSLAILGSFFSLNFFRALGALALVILIFGLLVWIFERKGNPEEFGQGAKGLWSGFWWSAVTMTTVGYGDKSPKTTGGRVVALVWMFTAIIIISGFTASIASSLTVNTIGSSGTGIQDFKDRPVGTIAQSGTDAWLANHFFNNRQHYASVGDMLVALDKDEIDAIAYDKPILQSILREDTLSAYRISDAEFNAQFYAMGMNRALPDSLQHLIELSILEQIETMDWRVMLSEYDLE